MGQHRGKETPMRISDVIAAYILNRIEEADGGVAELQRNLLAEEIGCVPSQINYVLTSRFTPEQGFIVESRRGGGGYIRIHRVQTPSPLSQLVRQLPDTLDSASAQNLLQNLLYRELIQPDTARLLAVALSDRSYKDVPPERRDKLRATMMKQLLTALSL